MPMRKFAVDVIALLPEEIDTQLCLGEVRSVVNARTDS